MIKTLSLARLIPFSKNAYKEVYIDRGMLITDFFLATIIPYIVQFLLWSWFYRNTELIEFNGYQYQTLMIYYVLVIAFNRLNNGYSIVEFYSGIVHSGSISSLSCKPSRLINQRLADFIGGSILYYVPVFIAFSIYISLNAIDVLQIFIGFATLISVLVLSQILCFYISYTFAVFCFILYRPHFLLNLLSAFQIILGGVLVPYSFWPERMQALMEFNPFYYIISAPSEIVIGTYKFGLANYIFITIAYIVVFRFMTSFLEKYLRRRSYLLGG